MGEKFGLLVVLREIEPRHDGKRFRRMVECQCDCGEVVISRVDRINPKDGLSCGCTRNKFPFTHGLSDTPTYRVWVGLINRGTGKISRKNYYDRGIRVCERWLLFTNFFEDMGLRPAKYMTVERVDNDKGYSKENCIWADRKTQGRNRRTNRKIQFQGAMRCVSEIAELIGMNEYTLRARLRLGWTPEDAVSSPVQQRRT